MRIQHNIAALNAHRQLGGNNSAVAKNLEKLSSGYKINRAGDDAAGLAISEKMRAQIKGLETASKNAEDGVSLIQTAEGALTEVHSMLNRMVELATQSANGTYGATERSKIQDEVTNLMDEIDRISTGTDFNGTKLLDGSLGGYDATQLVTMANGVTDVTVTGGNLDKADKIQFNTTLAADGKLTVNMEDIPDGLELVALNEDGTIINNAAPGTTDGVQLDPTKGGTVRFKVRVRTDATGKDTTKLDADKYAGIELTVTVAAAKKDETTGKTLYTGDAIDEGNQIFTATGKGLKLQVGDTNEDYQKVSVKVGKMNSEALKIRDNVDVSSQDAAGKAISYIKGAIETVSKTRGNLGALQNRLDHTINNLGVTTENMSAAESRIRDVDMAKEMMDFTKNNILTQSAQAMLAQANQIPQGVLQLLQ